MNLLATVSRIFLIWVTLVAARMVAATIVSIQAPALRNMLYWFMAANFLIAVATAVMTERSTWRRWQISFAACAVLFVIDLIDIIEGVVFLHLHIWGRLLGQLVIFYALLAPLWMLILNKDKREAITQDRGHLAVSGKLWRFLLSDLAYLLLYFAAGTIIFPFVRGYYASQALPSQQQVALLQFLVRGPLFVCVCILMTRMLRMTGALGWLATGAVFAVVSGVAPLMVPNPYFPDSVRWVHFWEVSVSNFLFAAFVSWVWSAPQPKAVVATEAELSSATGGAGLNNL